MGSKARTRSHGCRLVGTLASCAARICSCAVGDDITIVGISNMVVECLRVREMLEHAGISSEVIDPISLAPLDMETILQSARRTGRLLIVDNAWTSCGMSAEIAARAVESLHPGEHVAVQNLRQDGRVQLDLHLLSLR